MCVIWGIPYLLIRVAVRELSPATLVFARTTLALLVLLVFPAARAHLRRLLPRWRPLLAFAAIEIAVPWLLLSHAEVHLTSSITGLLIATVPLIGAVVVALTGDGEPLDGRRLIGLLVGLAGVAAIVGVDTGRIGLISVLEIGAVAVGYAVGPIILTRHLSDLPTLPVLAFSLAVCAMAYTAPALARLPSAMPSGRVVASVVGLAVVCTALAFVLFFALIAEVGPARATVITYINPAVAAVLGVLVLDETFTAAMGVGFGLVLVGSVLATRRNSTVSAESAEAGS